MFWTYSPVETLIILCSTSGDIPTKVILMYYINVVRQNVSYSKLSYKWSEQLPYVY